MVSYKLNWFEKHINLTWLLCLVVYAVIVMISPYAIVASWLVILGITIWGLNRKHRSYWWVLLPFMILFLLNKGTRNPDPDY